MSEANRKHLPSRRRSNLSTVSYREMEYEIGVSFYENNTAGELFISGARIGSESDALLADVAVLISRALQHGDTLHNLAKAMGREGGDGIPSSMVGVALDAGVGILESLSKEG